MFLANLKSGICLTAIIIGMTGSPVNAKTTSDDREKDKDSIVVTGQNIADVEAEIAETRRTYPGSVATVTPDELELQNASNLGDVLARIPGVVYVDEDGRGTKPNIGLRGLNPIRSEYTQILHDGVPTQPSIYSEQAAYYGVPAERVSGIEVFKGGASILFGPNTVGGVVNYLTRGPSVRPFAAIADGRIDTNGDVSGNIFLSGTRGDTGYGLEYLHKEGEGFGESRDYNIEDAELTLAHALDENNDIRLHLQFYDEVSQTPGGLLRAQFDDDNKQSNKPNDFFFGKRYEADIRTQHQLGARASLELLAYAYSFERNWYLQNYVSNGTPDLTLADNNGQFLRKFQTYGFEPKFSVGYDLGAWADNRLTVGARIYYDQVDRRVQLGNSGNSREDDAVLTSFDDNSTFVAAVYAQNETKPAENLSIVPGVRYEHIVQKRTDVLADGPQSTASYDIVVPGLGIRYGLGAGSLVYANVTKSFRPPTSGNSFDPTIVTGNFNLGASTSWTYEAGFRAEPHDWLQADLGVFYTDYSDQVVVSAGTASNFDTEAYGFEGTARIGLFGLADRAGPGQPHEIYLHGGATLVDSTFSNGAFAGNELPYTPDTSLTFGVQYSYDDRADLLFQGRHLSGQFTDNANTVAENDIATIGRIDGYTVLDIKARWQVSNRLSLSAGVNNLTDKEYGTQRRTSQQKGLFAGPRRTGYVAVKASF